MPPRRTRVLLAATMVVLMLLFGACEDGAPKATPIPTPSPSITAEATGTPSATPVASATPLAFRPAPDTALARWERIEADAPLPAHRAYRLETDEIWGFVRDDGVEMFFGAAPFLFFGPGGEHTRFIGTVQEHEPAGETVIVDLATGETTQILPFGVQRAQWSGPGQVWFALQYPVIRAGVTEVPAGEWVLDLATSEIVPAAVGPSSERFALPARLGDGTYLPGATAVMLRPQGLARHFSLVLVDEAAGAERVMDESVLAAAWSASPDGRWLAYVTAANTLRAMDLGTGEVRTLGVPAERGRPLWSPDSRFIADSYRWYEGYHAVIFDVPGAFAVALGLPSARIGPIEDAWPLAWHPSAPELLMFGDYCLPGGTRFDVLDAGTGEIRRIPTAVTGAWQHGWSPDGTMLAVAAPNLPVGLIDPVSGRTIPTPALERIEDLQLVSWAAGGEWLVLGDMPGIGRCY